MALIAGHLFEDTPTGRRCVGHSSIKDGPCMASWLNVRKATEADIDSTIGIAHISTMNCAEFAQIRAAVALEEAIIWQAVIDAASSGSK